MTKWRETKEGYAFARKYEEVTKDVVPVRLNDQQQDWLLHSMFTLQEPKPSSALKKLAQIGANVIHSSPTHEILTGIFKQIKNNERTGAFIDNETFKEK